MMGFGETVLNFDADVPSNPKDLKLREIAFLCMPIRDDQGAQVSNKTKPAFLTSTQWARLHALDSVISHRSPSPTFSHAVLQDSDSWEAFVKAISPELESIDQLIDSSAWNKPLNLTLVKLLVIRALRPERLSVAVHMAVKELTGIVTNSNPAYRSALPHLVDDLVPLLQAPEVGPGYVSRIVPIVLVQGPDSTSTIGMDYVETMAQARSLPRSKFERAVFLPGEHAAWQDTLDAAFRKGCWLAVQNIEVLGDEIADLWQCIQTVGMNSSGGRADAGDMMLEEEEDETDELGATANSASNFRLFLTTHIGSELPSILEQSSLLVTCEHSTNLQSTLVDAHRVLSGGNGGERLGAAITTPLERACISAMCVCQSQVGTKLRDNMLQDAATGSQEFFGADIAHAAREMPFMTKTQDQSPASVVAGFAECATRLYSGSCENQHDRTLCKLYVQEWFENDPTEKLRAAVPALVEALGGSSDDWLASMRDAVALSVAAPDAEVVRLPDEGEEAPDSLVSNACNVFNAAFKFNMHVGPVESYENPGSASAPTDLQSSIRILAESISSQLPKSLNLPASPAHSNSAVGKVLLQECELMNSRIKSILLRLHELDMRASNSEMPETNEMVKQLMALHRGRVPPSWLTHETKSAVHLYDWLGHLCAAAVLLQDWLEDATGACPSALRLGYISNISGLLVAFRQDVVRNKGWDPEEAVVELEPASADSKSQDNQLPIEGVALVGGHWDGTNRSLALSETVDSQQSIALSAVCRQRPSRPSSSNGEEAVAKPQYICPVYDGGKNSVRIAVMMDATSSETDLTKRGVRMEIPGSEAL